MLKNGKDHVYFATSFRSRASHSGWNKYLLNTREINMMGGNHTVEAKLVKAKMTHMSPDLLFLTARTASPK